VTADLDNRIRLAVYEHFVEDGEAPGSDDIAGALGLAIPEVEQSFRRLQEARVLALIPGTTQIWMANPFSAVPTAFSVETPRGSYYGNCVWDGLGVVSMLGGDGMVETRCGDCEEPMTLRVEGRQLVEGYGIAHFAVPASRWWENIGFT
jgi:hypothetical protein